MWIFLSVLGVIAVVITALLLSPVLVIIKTDENDELILRYKLLNKLYGENPDPKNPVVRALKKTSGISRLETDRMKTNLEEAGVYDTLKESIDLVLDLLKKIVQLLKKCSAKVFRLNIVIAEGDAAQTAISYGKTCAMLYPVLGLIYSIINVKKKGEDVSLNCDYEGKEGTIDLEIILSIPLYRVLGAFIRVVYKEALRQAEDNAAAMERRKYEKSLKQNKNRK